MGSIGGVFDNSEPGSGDWGSTPKKDECGPTVDLHALRHVLGTHLSKNGVAPRTAQAAMRHSSIDLTMNTYTDPELLDVRGALEALPELPLSGENGAGQERATGTDGTRALAPMLAPKSDYLSISETIAGTTLGARTGKSRRPEMAQNAVRGALGASDGSKEVERAKGLEPSTFSLGS